MGVSRNLFILPSGKCLIMANLIGSRTKKTRPININGFNKMAML